MRLGHIPECEERKRNNDTYILFCVSNWNKHRMDRSWKEFTCEMNRTNNLGKKSYTYTDLLTWIDNFMDKEFGNKIFL